jgi:hypothetical protein
MESGNSRLVGQPSFERTFRASALSSSAAVWKWWLQPWSWKFRRDGRKKCPATKWRGRSCVWSPNACATRKSPIKTQPEGAHRAELPIPHFSRSWHLQPRGAGSVCLQRRRRRLGSLGSIPTPIFRQRLGRRPLPSKARHQDRSAFSAL